MPDKELTGECQSCGFKGAHTQIVMAHNEETKAKYQLPHEHCDICYNTLAGNAHRYPSQYRNRDLMQQISVVGNMILKKIDELGVTK